MKNYHKNMILLATFSSVLMACDREDYSKNQRDVKIENDNTEKNVRDRDLSTKTPVDQAENEVDRTVTQRIRKALMADESLSTNAKNIKVITINGVVTLRGPVANTAERDAIEKKVSDVQGVVKLDNQLEVLNRK